MRCYTLTLFYLHTNEIFFLPPGRQIFSNLTSLSKTATKGGGDDLVEICRCRRATRIHNTKFSLFPRLATDC